MLKIRQFENADIIDPLVRAAARSQLLAGMGKGKQ